MEKQQINEQDTAWLDLGFYYLEALFENGKIDALSFKKDTEDYARRGSQAAIGYI